MTFALTSVSPSPNMDPTEGSYRTLVTVNTPEEDDEKKVNGVEMTNLLDEDEDHHAKAKGMKRSETADLLNPTLHQVSLWDKTWFWLCIR